MLLQQLHFHSLPGHEFLGIPPPPQQDKDEAHPTNSNNSGTKTPKFLQFSHPCAGIPGETREWGFPCSQSSSHFQRNNSQGFLTRKPLLCDTGRDKTPLFVPDPCQPSHGSRELTPSEPREKQGHNSQSQERSTFPRRDSAGIKAQNSRGKKKITGKARNYPGVNPAGNKSAGLFQAGFKSQVLALCP